MALSANGSTVSFGGVDLGTVRVLSWSDGANEIDVTTLSDAQHVFEEGIPNIEATVEILGTTTDATRGDTGALSFSWNDGGSDSLGTALVTNVERTGSLDTEITTSITFRPAST